MKSNNPDVLNKAVFYLAEVGRPLEYARWRFFAGEGSSDEVMDELRAYANSDGGYGRALESDMRSPDSSVLATLEALDIMNEISLQADSPLRLSALRWLCDSTGGYDASTGLWPYLKAGMEEAPHAPWWEMENLPVTFGGFQLNPRGRVLAHLIASASSDKPIIPGEEVDLHLNAFLDAAESKVDTVPPDTLRSMLVLYDSLTSVAEGGDGRLETCITRLIPGSVVTDPAKWGEYGLQPLEVADSPDSRWLALLDNPVREQLDHLIASQGEDGSWAPFWTWGGGYPEAWKQASIEWKGVLTLKNLKRMRTFGRI